MRQFCNQIISTQYPRPSLIRPYLPLNLISLLDTICSPPPHPNPHHYNRICGLWLILPQFLKCIVVFNLNSWPSQMKSETKKSGRCHMPDLLSLRGVINDTHVLFHTVSAAPDVCALPNHQAVDDIDGQGGNDYASEEQQIINASCLFWAFDDSRAMAMAFSMNRRFYSRCRWLRLPRITYRHQAWCLFVFYLRSLACFHRSLQLLRYNIQCPT